MSHLVMKPFRVGLVLTATVIALVGPAALVPDANAGMPDTVFREQHVQLVAHSVPEQAGPADTPALDAPEPATADLAGTADPAGTADNAETADETPTAEATAATDVPADTDTVANPDTAVTPAPAATPSAMPTTSPAAAATAHSDDGVHDHGHDHVEDAASAIEEDQATTLSEPLPVEDVLMVGATWTSDDDVDVRSGSDGLWSEWIPLQRDSEHAPDPGTAEADGANPGASDPVFVGGADVVQFRSTDLAELDVSFVEVTGGEGLDWTPESANSAASAQAVPIVRSRAAWGADESLRNGSVNFSASGDVRFSVVHHVGGGYWTGAEIANGCARSDDWIRGIYAYHVNGNGWQDIGYNFVVDPCGTIWEARAGGITKAVNGAHAGGFNDGSVGVLALGTFSGADPDPVTSAMVASIEELLGWKLGMAGANPAGTTDEVSGGGSARWPSGTAVTLPVLSAHQVSNTTTCPGAALMSRLFTGLYQDGKPRSHYVSGVKSELTSTNGRFDEVLQSVSGSYEPAAGDFDGDGRDDVVWFGPGSARDYIWYGKADGSFRSGSINIPLGGQALAGDFDGSGSDDLLFYGPGTAADALWLARGGGGFSKTSVQVKGVYQPFVGDFDGDGSDDIFWYAPGAAKDWMWWGSPHGFSHTPRPVTGRYEPIVGQFDGARGDDILWYAAGSAADWLWMARPHREYSHRSMDVWGSYLPIALDRRDHDQSEILWYGPNASPDYFWRSTPGGTFVNGSATLGRLGTRPVIGDFNGDGRDDILYHNPGARPDPLWLRR